MQTLNQTRLKLFSASLLTLFIMSVLVSCSKNTSDLAEAQSATLSSTNQSNIIHYSENENAIPVERTFWVSCANGGVGEEVEVKGKNNVVSQVWYNLNTNRVTINYHVNSSLLTGVGLTTGETYIGTDREQHTLTGSMVNGQFEASTSEQVRLMGQNTRLVMRYTFHVTVNSDYEIVTSMSIDRVDCN